MEVFPACATVVLLGPGGGRLGYPPWLLLVGACECVLESLVLNCRVIVCAGLWIVSVIASLWDELLLCD